jgi:glycosyltransferase involved in cell wall biosynthesis
MRIAYVTETYPPEINGVALTVARTVAHLRARGHAVELVRPCQDGECPGDCRGAAGDEWHARGWPIPVYREMRFGLARPSTLAARFALTRPQIVHVATEGPLGWAAVRAARRLGLPATSDFRTNFHSYSRYYGLGWAEGAIAGYLRRFHNGTARSFAPTRQVQRTLAEAGFERVEVVGRGVDAARFTLLRRDAALRARWGADPLGQGPVLLYVGRVAAEKNVALALRAYRAARAAVPSARMVVVGDGPLLARLRREHPDVTFAGRQCGEALAAHYASADVFLFPSLTDTFGNVTLEALASALPVVAFDVAAAAEHVVHGVSGLLAEPGDEAAFEQAACALARAHPLGLEPMRRAARMAALRADWRGVMRRFEEQLAEVAHAHDERTGRHLACTA